MLNHITYFRIAGHNVTVIGSDGAYTKPLTTDYMAVSPGQTINFLLEANKPPSHYYMVSRVYSSKVIKPPATGIIEYAGNYTLPSSPPLPEFPDSAEPSDFTKQLRSLSNANHLPLNVVTDYLFLVLSVNVAPCNTSRCEEKYRLLTSMNNVSMALPETIDILDAYYREIGGVYTTDFPFFSPAAFDFTNGQKQKNESHVKIGTVAKVLEYNSTVEIVFQGTNMGSGVNHPIHLHGYSFYLLGTGFGNFDAARDRAGYNLVDPPLMESITVPTNGWATIRFKANNPGVWLLHCHLESHQSWGMKMVLIVKDGKAPDEKMLPPPPDMPRCGGGRQVSPESGPLLFSDKGRFENPDSDVEVD